MKAKWKWTDHEIDTLRAHRDAPAAQVAARLGRTPKAVNKKRWNLRRQDEQERFTHVADAAEAPRPLPRIALSLSAAPEAPRPLTDKEQRAKLRDFRLYEGMYDDPAPEPRPSLWTRLTTWLKRPL